MICLIIRIMKPERYLASTSSSVHSSRASQYAFDDAHWGDGTRTLWHRFIAFHRAYAQTTARLHLCMATDAEKPPGRNDPHPDRRRLAEQTIHAESP